MMIISILLLQMGYIVERQDCNQREFVIVLRPWGQDFVDVQIFLEYVMVQIYF